MAKLKRFGVSLETELLDALDGMVERHQFPNRSQAIRHLIRSQSAEENWTANRNVAGALILVYDHHKRNVLEESTHIQHHFQNLIICTQHVHLDHSNCLEILALKGKARDLEALADRLIAIKGVKHGKLVASDVT